MIAVFLEGSVHYQAKQRGKSMSSTQGKVWRRKAPSSRTVTLGHAWAQGLVIELYRVGTARRNSIIRWLFCYNATTLSQLGLSSGSSPRVPMRLAPALREFVTYLSIPANKAAFLHAIASEPLLADAIGPQPTTTAESSPVISMCEALRTRPALRSRLLNALFYDHRNALQGLANTRR